MAQEPVNLARNPVSETDASVESPQTVVRVLNLLVHAIHPAIHGPKRAKTGDLVYT
jgi:hypothetical protein